MLLIIVAILLILAYIFLVIGIVKNKTSYAYISGICFIGIILIGPRVSDIERNSKRYTITTEIRQKVVNDSIMKSDTIYIIKYKTIFN